ncbi:MAG: exodeoxyribonuclease large subunit [Chloroflexota bacterium]
MVGEVQSAVRSAAGHEYITLKDEGATLDIVRFRSAIRGGEEPAGPGEIVVARGRIDLYPARSRYQLVATSIRRAGTLGLLSRELEALKRRLAAEGLFDEARKVPIPVAPPRIGIVTSRSGAVLHDVVRVLRQRAPGARLLLAHAAVQGGAAPAELAAAVARLDRSGLVDVILLARGGGSADDLAAFNDEGLLRAIAACTTPIVSAVGHEADVTLADLVADARAGTPSIAAALVAPPEGAARAGLARLGERAADALAALLDEAGRSAEAGLRGLRRASPLERIAQAGERLAQAGDDAVGAVHRHLDGAGSTRAAAAALLAALSPYGVLERGYAIVTGPDGRVLRSTRGRRPADRVRVRLADGAFRATIEGIEGGSDDGGTN